LTPFNAVRAEGADLTARNDWAWLDCNESSWPPYGDFAAACNAHRYAEPQPQAIRERLASLYNVTPESILLCRGSEEAPDLLIRSFCEQKREGVVLCPPTFGIYTLAADVNEAPVRHVPLREDHGFDLDVDAILNNWQPHEKIIFIPTPHAPMGHAMPPQQIEALLNGLAGRAIVVVDQAYMEFSRDVDWTQRLKDFSHLVIMRTLSKAYALAGIRIGALIAAPALAEKLLAVLPAYPISAAMVPIVTEALSLEGIAQAQKNIATIIAERQRLANALPTTATITKVFPSDGNFLFVETTDSTAFVALCQSHGIVVRNRTGDRTNCVRIGVGSPEENTRLLAALGVHA
jgi:histidinol-phosphate aminotransferase